MSSTSAVATSTNKALKSLWMSLAVIVVSEIGDKTFLIAAVMAMTNPRFVIFCAALSALGVMTILSTLFGHFLPNLLSKEYTQYAASFLFVVFGFKMLYDGYYMTDNEGQEELEEVTQELMERDEERDDGSLMESGKADKKTSEKKDLEGIQAFVAGLRNVANLFFSAVFIQCFVMTFLAEWGDRSQIATIALAGAEDFWWVTIGSLLGHSICTAGAVIGGRMLASKISVRTGLSEKAYDGLSKAISGGARTRGASTRFASIPATGSNNPNKPFRFNKVATLRGFKTYPPASSSTSEPSPPPQSQHIPLNSLAKERDLLLSILNAKPSKRDARLFVNKFLDSSTEANLAPVTPVNILAGVRLGVVRIDANLSQHDLDVFAGTLVSMHKLGLSPIVAIDFETHSTASSIIHARHIKEAASLHTIISVLPHRRKRSVGTGFLRPLISVSPPVTPPVTPPVNGTGRQPRGNFTQLPPPSSPLSATRAFMISECNRVVEAIERAGGSSVPIHSSVFTTPSSPLSVTSSHLDSTVPPTCDIALLLRHLKRRCIPVVLPLCVTQDEGKTKIISSRDTMMGLVAGGIVDVAVKPPVTQSVLLVEKNILLNGESLPATSSATRKAQDGLLCQNAHMFLPVKLFLMNDRIGGVGVDGRHVALVNLAEEGKDLIAALKDNGNVSGAQGSGRKHVYNDAEDNARILRDLETARELLAVLGRVNPSSSAVIAAIDRHTRSDLLANWITDKPLNSTPNVKISDVDGVLVPPTILRTGLTLQTHTGSLENIDLSRLEALLNSSFGKKLNGLPYFNRLKKCVSTVILAGDYDGAVIVTSEFANDASGSVVHYLDKLAVRPESQGLGVADILWKRLVEAYPNLCWRSRSNNPVNKWYFDRSDGNMKFGEDKYWMMFWYGDKGLARLNEYKAVCESIEASFLQK
ncbi:hypothetical protein HK100_004053 [Physocladia obscura]|uniref:N-acetyltransferase domain-containing protein n=1 Tax=Physocladia obscura TaxID=109957 RepID=A0AAD5SZ77_9FUNG|nr:hypothetical protein HK100_004053 [Physocladia obscura]